MKVCWRLETFLFVRGFHADIAAIPMQGQPHSVETNWGIFKLGWAFTDELISDPTANTNN